MAMSPNRLPRFGKTFLEETDKYISTHFDQLTCDDIWNLYFDFFQDLKEFKGNSHGFTGLSEYLVFRLLYHLLGGDFIRKTVTKDVSEFVSMNDENLHISQGTQVDAAITGKRRLCPDIKVVYGNKLLSVCQIKIYLTMGYKEIQKELESLDYLKRCCHDLQALLLVFWSLSPQGKIMSYLQAETSKRTWFRYHFLRGDSRVLVDILKDGLGLETILRPKE